MEIKDKEMLHIHIKGIHDDIWQVGNELLVDERFNSHLTNNFDIPSGVKDKNGDIVLLETIQKDIINKISSDEEILNLRNLSDDEILDKMYFLRDTLKETTYRLHQLGLRNREESLEEVRKEFYPNLPSRYHSLWVCDQDSYEYWRSILGKRETESFSLLLNGNLFKSSDTFLPTEGALKKEQKEEAHRYWNPTFITEEDELKKEYLFQGRVKILKKL